MDLEVNTRGVTEEKHVIVTLDPKLELALKEQAIRQGVAPEQLALSVLREHLCVSPAVQPRDEWERELLDSVRPWGVSLSNNAVSSDGIYE